MSDNTRHAIGSIEVSRWAPEPYDDAGGVTLNQIDVIETFRGDINGGGRAQMLQSLRADGSASFVGLERVTAELAGRSGTFVLQDTGTLDADGRVDGTWFVVPGSGTGDLGGLRGTGTFTAVLGEQAEFALDYWFD